MIVPPLRMMVTRKFGGGQPDDVREVGWPSHWRLPLIGESIVLPSGSGGTITWVGWDLAAAVVRITVR